MATPIDRGEEEVVAVANAYFGLRSLEIIRPLPPQVLVYLEQLGAELDPERSPAPVQPGRGGLTLIEGGS